MEATREELGRFFSTVMPHLNEVQRRVVAGAMARELGRGGKTAVAVSSGMSRNTVVKAQGEVEAGISPAVKLRLPGAGDKQAIDKQPGLLDALDELVHPETRGTPMGALRWTLKSTYQLARELQSKGYKASAELVRRLLHQMGYSLQTPSKQNEGTQNPDRDGQFSYLNEVASGRLAAGEPVISVDTKKKELIGNYANGGREWQPAGEPERVEVHDFADPELGEFAKAIPYGVYDAGNDQGWVSVGDTADTAEFAVESIRRWWYSLGSQRFPDATRLLLTADAGGSNGYRVRAWKYHLAKLAAETGLEITVCHYPPGTSKWNKIEHRLFSLISMNWRGRPLTDIRTIVELIAATTTTSGLTVQCDYNPHWYATGVKVSKAEFAAIPLQPHDWHGDWNYTISATSPSIDETAVEP